MLVDNKIYLKSSYKEKEDLKKEKAGKAGIPMPERNVKGKNKKYGIEMADDPKKNCGCSAGQTCESCETAKVAESSIELFESVWPSNKEMESPSEEYYKDDRGYDVTPTELFEPVSPRPLTEEPKQNPIIYEDSDDLFSEEEFDLDSAEDAEDEQNLPTVTEDVENPADDPIINKAIEASSREGMGSTNEEEDVPDLFESSRDEFITPEGDEELLKEYSKKSGEEDANLFPEKYVEEDSIIPEEDDDVEDDGDIKADIEEPLDFPSEDPNAPLELFSAAPLGIESPEKTEETSSEEQTMEKAITEACGPAYTRASEDLAVKKGESCGHLCDKEKSESCDNLCGRKNKKI